MKPLAVSQRVDVVTARGERRDALDQRLVAFLRRAGFQPFPVPNGLANCQFDALSEWLNAITPAGIVLSGGNDIGDCPERDDTERSLCLYAERRRLPILGICRGMQFLGVLRGGTLVPVEGHVATRHRVSGPYSGEVNSYHNLGFVELPEEFHMLARADDGLIEAIRHKEMPWEGWMWHPEREPEFRQEDLARIQALLNQQEERQS